MEVCPVDLGCDGASAEFRIRAKLVSGLSLGCYGRSGGGGGGGAHATFYLVHSLSRISFKNYNIKLVYFKFGKF